MSLRKVDSNLVRQARFAYTKSAYLRSIDSTADEVFSDLRRKSDALLAAARAVIKEEIDDPSKRSDRDGAVLALRGAIQARLRRFKGELTVHTTDESGTLIDATSAAVGEAILKRWIPDGMSRLPASPELLILATRNIQDSMSAIPWTDATMQSLDPLVDALEAAAAAVGEEQQELSAARKARDTAFAEAERVLGAARTYTDFVCRWKPELGLDLRAMFPVAPYAQPSTEASALDDAGVPQVEGDEGPSHTS